MGDPISAGNPIEDSNGWHPVLETFIQFGLHDPLLEVQLIGRFDRTSRTCNLIWTFKVTVENHSLETNVYYDSPLTALAAARVAASERLH